WSRPEGGGAPGPVARGGQGAAPRGGHDTRQDVGEGVPLGPALYDDGHPRRPAGQRGDAATGGAPPPPPPRQTTHATKPVPIAASSGAGSWWDTAGEARMQDDSRAEAAQYYDANPTIPDDLAFYTVRLPSPDAAVLELGCGTGRVLLPLAAVCGSIYGLDRSPAMLARCVQKLQAAGMPPAKARAELGDITHFALGRQFEVIIAPYRVFQLLETDPQVDGLFRSVRAHLAPGGP